MAPPLVLGLMISGLTVFPILLLPPLHTIMLHRRHCRWRHHRSSRKGRALMGQLQNLGVLMILSFRGREGWLATKFTLLRAKSKGLLGRVLGGLRIGILRWFMDGGDLNNSWGYPLLFYCIYMVLFCLDIEL